MEKLKELTKMIDHSILHPTFTDQDLKEGCEIAKKYEVASVCVKPYMVKEAVVLLKGTDVKVGCVIGFPHGNSYGCHTWRCEEKICVVVPSR